MEQSNSHPELNAAYWSNRWKTGETGWDIGYPSPALVKFANLNIPKWANILIPGAGNGYEAEWLHNHGWTEVKVLDIAREPLDQLRERLPVLSHGHLIHEDFFAHKGHYHFILEQTFFCALDPARRSEYVEHMHRLLTPDGTLAGLLFNFPLTEVGPPFGGSEAEYRQLMEPYFTLREMGPCADSIAPRAGSELFFVAKRK